MKCLYAPWRTAYATAPDKIKRANTAPHDCVFCNQLADQRDDAHYIIKRFKHVFIVLNRYPYNAGHSMVIPYEHKSALKELNPEVCHEIMDVTALSADILMHTLGATGMNIGLNLGKVAGGSIPSHLHMHLVPRWEGDTNFMVVLGDTKVVSVDLNDTYAKLKKAFANT